MAIEITPLVFKLSDNISVGGSVSIKTGPVSVENLKSIDAMTNEKIFITYNVNDDSTLTLTLENKGELDLKKNSEIMLHFKHVF